MGSIHSKLECNGNKCNCFRFDTNTKRVNIRRDLNIKWIWTDDHQSILTDTLSDSPYNTPKDIISIIKDYAYCLDTDYHMKKAIMCAEKNYMNQKHLLNKPLCTHWCCSQKSLVSAFSVLLCGLDKLDFDQRSKFIESLNEHSLPSLQPSYSSSSSSYSSDPSDSALSTRKTVNINQCSVRMHLHSLENDLDWKKIQSNDICLILLDAYDSTDDIHTICNKISMCKHSMKSCILVKLSQQRLNKNEMRKISQTHNVPLFILKQDDPQSITNMFSFAVKYHWFCNVNK